MDVVEVVLAKEQGLDYNSFGDIFKKHFLPFRVYITQKTKLGRGGGGTALERK